MFLISEFQRLISAAVLLTATWH